jgi:hypothetical protein
VVSANDGFCVIDEAFQTNHNQLDLKEYARE